MMAKARILHNPGALSAAQRTALLKLLDAENAGVALVNRRNQKKVMHPGTLGWLSTAGYVLYLHIGNLEFQYQLTPQGRKLARLIKAKQIVTAEETT